MKVCHLTTVHPRSDVRIFKKECISLSDAGYDVMLLVADDLPEAQESGVRIKSVGKIDNRFLRMIISVFRTYREASRSGADIFHFHDPELIPAGLLLKLKRKVVICDVHEDVPGDIMNKPYLPTGIRYLLAGSIRFLQFLSYRLFDYIISATPAIRKRLLRYNARTMDINNFPVLVA